MAASSNDSLVGRTTLTLVDLFLTSVAPASCCICALALFRRLPVWLVVHALAEVAFLLSFWRRRR
jgi:hypothetical protein